MRIFILASLFISAGCRQSPSYELYRDPAGFTVEVPKGWPRDAHLAPAGKPAVTTEFIGDAEPSDQGIALGAVLTVTRLSRKAGAKMSASTKALFSDDAATPAESEPYARDYEHGGPTPLHQNATPVPMRVEGRVFRTPEAFFIVELRAVRGQFERNRPTLERALATFRPD